MLKRTVLLFLISLAAVNCQQSDEPLVTSGDDGSAAQQASNAAALFSDSVGSFEVMVFYEVGATPYVGNITGTSTNIWELTKSSFTALFNNHVGRFIFVPNIIGQMIQIPDQNKTSWSQSELFKLGDQYAPDLMHQGDARLSIIFLNGSYNGNGDILGTHIRGTQFAFVFKDNVAAAGGDAKAQAYIEQAAVVHNLGHASGLVNNGVPMVGNYEDPQNPHHNKNPQCVMNAMIDSRMQALGALATAISSNRLILFGSEPLVDGRTYHP